MKMNHALLVVLALGVTANLMAGEKKAAAKDGWITMFDGKTFDGWKINENKDTWKIVDGAMVCKGPRSHAFYAGKGVPFTNFEFTANVMTKPKSNAGIYFHTKFQDSGWPRWGYECQINNTHRDPRKTASIYAVKDVLKAPAQDNKWFTVYIKVQGKKVTVKVDGKTVNEYTEPEGKKSFSNQFDRLLGSGTFALQGHDPISEVHFKDLKVRPLK